MPVCTGTDRLAGLIPPFIHSFLKMPYPETDGIRYFFRLAPVCGGQPTQKGTAERLSPGGIAARIGLALAEALRKGHTHTEATGLRPRVPSRHAENLWGHAAGMGPTLAEALRKGHTHTESPDCVPERLLPAMKKGQPNGCPLGVSVPGRIRAPCSGSPSDGGSGGLQTALPVYFPPASCRPPGRSHGWQPPGQSPSHG